MGQDTGGVAQFAICGPREVEQICEARDRSCNQEDSLIEMGSREGKCLNENSIVEVEAEVIQSIVGTQQGHRTIEGDDLVHTPLSQEIIGAEPELRKRYSTRPKNRTWSWKDAARRRNNGGEVEGESSNRGRYIARERRDFC